MPETTCNLCKGTEWVLEESDSGTVAKRCKCFHERETEILFDQAKIPKRYKHCAFKNFEEHNDSHRDALKIAKKFVKNYPVQDIGLLFQGPCGIGKTHLAVAIINELIKKKNIPCYFCDFRNLIRTIQSTYTPETSLTESEVLEPVFQKEVLVLDELGAKRTTAWVEDTVFYIINRRYNNKKVTVFTSNYIDSGEEEEDARDHRFKKSDDSLVDRIGVRLRSRIYEMCKIVEMWGKDYRKEIKQAGYRF